MLRSLLLAAAAALAAAAPAFAKSDTAADPSLASAFKGTIVSVYPDGRKGKLWLDRDGGYTAAGRRGDASSGHWSIKGEKVCLKQSKPFPTPFAFCTPKPTSTTWQAKAVSGEAITVHIEPGGRAG